MGSIAIIDAVRTPFGRFGGSLLPYSNVELGAFAAKEVIRRCGLKPEDIEETLFGSGLLVGATFVAARQLNFKVGIPENIPSLTIDRACCSSMTAIGLARLKLQMGETSIVLAAGADSFSKTPLLMRNARWGSKLGDMTVEDPAQIRNPITGRALAEVTGVKALEFDVPREEQDEWALRSHQTYYKALEKGVFKEEVVPIDLPNGTRFAADEQPRRDASLEKLGKLSTVYGSPTVTAGNVPGLNDGGSALILMRSEEAGAKGMQPLAEVISYAQVCGDLESSIYMPANAIKLAAQKANISLSDLKRIEINEAFAAMPLVSTKVMADGNASELRRLRSITNVNGGSVAIGHPPGASGARITMALARELRRIGGGYGAASICGGYGQADAVILKV